MIGRTAEAEDGQMTETQAQDWTASCVTARPLISVIRFLGSDQS